MAMASIHSHMDLLQISSKIGNNTSMLAPWATGLCWFGPCLNWGVLLPGRVVVNLAGTRGRCGVKFPLCQHPQLLAPWVECGGVPRESPFGQAQDEVAMLLEELDGMARPGHACHPVSPGTSQLGVLVPLPSAVPKELEQLAGCCGPGRSVCSVAPRFSGD